MTVFAAVPSFFKVFFITGRTKFASVFHFNAASGAVVYKYSFGYMSEKPFYLFKKYVHASLVISTVLRGFIEKNFSLFRLQEHSYLFFFCFLKGRFQLHSPN